MVRMTMVLVLVASALAAAGSTRAAEPDSGHLSHESMSVTWTGGPFDASQSLGCQDVAGVSNCDRFELSVDAARGTNVRVSITSGDPGADFDLEVRRANGTIAARAANIGSQETVTFAHDPLVGSAYTVLVQPFSVTAGESTYTGLAELTGSLSDPEKTDCTELVPHALTLPTDDTSQRVTLTVRVLMDPRRFPRVDLRPIAERAFEASKKAYDPLNIDLVVDAYELVEFTGTEAPSLNAQARAHFGGGRPAGVDLVYTITNKDITVDGDTSVAGMADCIGGVETAENAFAVGEVLGSVLAVGGFDFLPDATAIVAAHELGHLMGAHHHYANCHEGRIDTEAGHLTPCSLMFPQASAMALKFSTLNGSVTRAHAATYAAP